MNNWYMSTAKNVYKTDKHVSLWLTLHKVELKNSYELFWES